MISYRPTDGDVYTGPIKYRPKTCFIMTKLGKPIPPQIANMRRTLHKYLDEFKIEPIDANSLVTGKDFLLKIWEMIFSVPLGIAIISEDLEPGTLSNIFYEIGLLHSLGKETVVIKTKGLKEPSDFVRTEYIEYDRRKFKERIQKFLRGYIEQADYYKTMSQQLKHSPLIAIDYLRRSYLISGEDEAKREAERLLETTTFDSHTTETLTQFLGKKIPTRLTPSPRIIFAESFTEFGGWSQYKGGMISLSADIPAHSGKHCLKKHARNDPNGGYKLIGSKIGLDFTFRGWIYRPSTGNGGLADRIALEDSRFNGYGFVIAHGGNAIAIERRDGGLGRTIANTKVLPVRDEWYEFEFISNRNHQFALYINNSKGERLAGIIAEDTKYSVFDRIVIHGGHTYYVDDLTILS